mgnify:CR=1 FL=1
MRDYSFLQAIKYIIPLNSNEFNSVNFRMELSELKELFIAAKEKDLGIRGYL